MVFFDSLFGVLRSNAEIFQLFLGVDEWLGGREFGVDVFWKGRSSQGLPVGIQIGRPVQDLMVDCLDSYDPLCPDLGEWGS